MISFSSMIWSLFCFPRGIHKSSSMYSAKSGLLRILSAIFSLSLWLERRNSRHTSQLISTMSHEGFTGFLYLSLSTTITLMSSSLWYLTSSSIWYVIIWLATNCVSKRGYRVTLISMPLLALPLRPNYHALYLLTLYKLWAGDGVEPFPSLDKEGPPFHTSRVCLPTLWIGDGFQLPLKRGLTFHTIIHPIHIN